MGKFLIIISVIFTSQLYTCSGQLVGVDVQRSRSLQEEEQLKILPNEPTPLQDDELLDYSYVGRTPRGIGNVIRNWYPLRQTMETSPTFEHKVETIISGLLAPVNAALDVTTKAIHDFQAQIMKSIYIAIWSPITIPILIVKTILKFVTTPIKLIKSFIQ